MTLAIHAHDILYYVLGPIKSVFARTATKVNPIETEDCVSASLEMVDGSLASLSVTTGSTVEISRHRFCLKNLTAESNTASYSNTSDPWTFTGDSPEITDRINEALTRFTPLPERFVGQFYRFSEAFRKGTELPVTLADARASLELITALYYSAQTGQAVNLPLAATTPNTPVGAHKGSLQRAFLSPIVLKLQGLSVQGMIYCLYPAFQKSFVHSILVVPQLSRKNHFVQLLMHKLASEFRSAELSRQKLCFCAPVLEKLFNFI